MERNITNIKERILHYTDIKGLSKEKFFDELAVTYGSFKGKAKTQALSSDVIERIITIHKDIDPIWLLTGKGEMIKGTEAINTGTMDQPTNPAIPLIPIDAMAGFGSGHTTQVMAYDTERYVVPEFSELNVEFLIRAKGSSMTPKYNSGDILGCKRLPMDTFFQWGKVYVIDTIQGPLVKRVFKSDMPGHIVCVSDNKDYPPFEIEFDSQVNAIAIVLGVIRLE